MWCLRSHGRTCRRIGASPAATGSAEAGLPSPSGRWGPNAVLQLERVDVLCWSYPPILPARSSPSRMLRLSPPVPFRSGSWTALRSTGSWASSAMPGSRASTTSGEARRSCGETAGPPGSGRAHGCTSSTRLRPWLLCTRSMLGDNDVKGREVLVLDRLERLAVP